MRGKRIPNQKIAGLARDGCRTLQPLVHRYVITDIEIAVLCGVPGLVAILEPGHALEGTLIRGRVL